MHKALAMFMLIGATLGGCTHLKGVVVEEQSGKPMRTAVLSVGRPGGLAVYATHRVDENGAFDFTLAPMDTTNIFLYDGAGDPETTMRHVEASEFSQNMKLRLRRARTPNIMLPTNININQ